MYAPGLVAADFNHDHKLDVAVNDGVKLNRTFLGNGDGTFATGPAYPTISNRGFLVATDLDGDGNIDLFSGFGNSGIFGGDDYLAGLVYALLGNGDGTFQGAPQLPIKYTGTNLLDLNNDGRPDMVGLITGPTETTLTTFLTGSNGIPVAGPQLIIPNGVSVDSYALGAFNTVSSTIPGLLYLTASPQVQTFNLAAGVGDGSFEAPTSFPVPSLVPTGNDINESLTVLRTGDFNHDGKLDIAYSFSDQASDTQIYYEGFAVQLGNGDGTFQAPKITLYLPGCHCASGLSKQHAERHCGCEQRQFSGRLHDRSEYCAECPGARTRPIVRWQWRRHFQGAEHTDAAAQYSAVDAGWRHWLSVCIRRFEWRREDGHRRQRLIRRRYNAGTGYRARQWGWHVYAAHDFSVSRFRIPAAPALANFTVAGGSWTCTLMVSLKVPAWEFSLVMATARSRQFQMAMAPCPLLSRLSCRWTAARWQWI